MKFKCVGCIFTYCRINVAQFHNKMNFNSCLEYCNRYLTVVRVLVNIMCMHMAYLCHVYTS